MLNYCAKIYKIGGRDKSPALNFNNFNRKRLRYPFFLKIRRASAHADALPPIKILCYGYLISLYYSMVIFVMV